MKAKTEPIVELTLPVDPGAVGEARQVVDRLAPLLRPESLEDVRLLVSELVTNAIRHGPKGAGDDVGLWVSFDSNTLRVQVTDRGEGFRPHRRDEDAIGGWGLVLVDEVSTRWGVEDSPPTRVWFELDGVRRPPESPTEGISLEHSERALHDSEERLRLALQAGGTGTWAWDIASGAVLWSSSLEEMHGLRPGTFGGSFEDSIRDIHPEDRAGVLERLERAVNADEPYELDYRIVRPDGAVRWIGARGTVVRDGAGKAERMAGISVDITERKEGQLALEIQYTVARVLADSATVEEASARLLEEIALGLGWEVGILWLRDEERRVMRVAGGWHRTASGKRFLGQSRSLEFARGVGLPGRVWERGRAEWVPDAAEERGLQRVTLALAEGLHAALAFPITLGGRVVGVMEFLSHRIREPDDALLRLMDAAGSQIGQFIERKTAESHVAEREARMEAMFATALEAIVTMAEDGTIVDMNPAAREMFGHEAGDVVGRDLADLLIPDDLRQRHRDGLERFRKTGRGRVLGQRLELEGMRADGSRFPVELTITLVDVPGRVLFTGYLRDISSRRRIDELGQRLLESERASRERLEVAHERMTFLADASMLLGSSLDVRKTLSKVARLAVPRLADWCSVEMVEPDGSIASLAVSHTDPEKVKVAREFRRRYPPHADDQAGIAAVIRTGESELIPRITQEMIQAAELDEDQLGYIRELGLRSAMTVPLQARGRVLGALSFASAESGRVFDEDDLALAENLAQRAAVAIDNAQLYQERSHIARTLQRTLLPRSLPEIPGLEIASFYQPAGALQSEVGGDFYDVFPAVDDGWGIVIGDVCGKGVEAAALTGLARHTLRATAVREASPSAVLSDLNDVLLREDGDRYCTVAFGRLESRAGTVRVEVSCGGHPMPVILRADGRVEQLGVPGSLIGLFETAAVHDRVAELAPADTLIFYTDGAIDPRRSDAMDEEDLYALIETCTGFDAQQTADLLGDAVSDAPGEAPDDTAILVLRVRP